MSITIIMGNSFGSMKWNCRTCDRRFADDRQIDACSERTGNGDCDNKKKKKGISTRLDVVWTARCQFNFSVAINIAQDASEHVRDTGGARVYLMKSLEMLKMHLNVGSTLRHMHRELFERGQWHTQTQFTTRLVDDRMTNHSWKFRRRFRFDQTGVQRKRQRESMKCKHSCSAVHKQYIVFLETSNEKKNGRNSQRISEWAAEKK